MATTSKKVVILGGIGNGSVIASAIEDAVLRGDEEWVVAGYLNDREEKGAAIQGFPVLGGVGEATRLAREGYFVLNTIYRIDGQQERIDLFDSLDLDDEQLVRFVHPTAYVAPDVEIGPGVVIMPNVSISPAATFGRGCLIMVAATIGHDTHFGKHCHVAAQACVGAYLEIEDGVHIGLNATIREELKIGRNATIGMGSVLTKSVGEGEIWAGNPARFLRSAK
jgi:sugar O-acyltransferase (sialic acid O-acetyltransferase NeuD family)